MITASIVTYNSNISELEKLLSCVGQSVIDTVYIVDNSENNEIEAMVSESSSKTKYIHGHGNIGYGRGHNIALRLAMEKGAKYHVVINPDILFEPGVISELSLFADKDRDTGLIMPRIEYPDGSLQYLCKLLPTPADLILRRFFPRGMFRKQRDKFELRFTGYNEIMNVPYLSGAFMFLRIETLRTVGLFDERFFMYGEDTDLSRRIHITCKTLFYPKVSILHVHEAASYKSGLMLWIHLKNLMIYFNKWGWIFDGERKRVNRDTLRELGYGK